jgi:hypothetical protein
MNGYRPGAGSPLTFLDTSNTAMDYAVDHSAPVLEQHQNTQTQSTPFGNSPIGTPNTNELHTHAELMIKADHSDQPFRQWRVNNTGYAQPAYQQHWSISTQSSTFSHARSSDNSIFSDFENRASTISTDSSLSNISSLSRSHYHAQAEHLLNGYSSPIPAYVASPVDAPAPQLTRKRNVPRIPTADKDHYKTCASRKQRARRANTVPKYFCTICKEPFVEKADWKRHEETYQERPEEFQCDICYARYFLDKDFVNHHVQAHKCVPCYANTRCSQKKHVQESRRMRKTRSGWGCGFCYHFSTNWTERCNHIADHFDREGKTMVDWHHSCVIYSLLQRPAVLIEWKSMLGSIKRPIKVFAWNAHSTGREEGYPDGGRCPRLQDGLEFFTSDQDAAALAQRAFDLAIKTVDRELAPPVPPKPKDYRMNHKASLQELTQNAESWAQFEESIVNHDQLPTGVAQPEQGAWNNYSTSWFDSSL